MKIKNLIFFIISFCYSTLLFAANDFPECPKVNFSGSVTDDQLAADYKCTQIRNAKQEMANKFNFKGKSDEEAQEFLTRVTTEFYRGLRECKSGNYDALINNMLTKVKIIGIRKDLCVVDRTTDYESSIPPPKIIVLASHCEFERVNLPIFTDDAAEIVTAFTDEKVKQKIRGNLEINKRANQTVDAVEGTFRKYCKDVTAKDDLGHEHD